MAKKPRKPVLPKARRDLTPAETPRPAPVSAKKYRTQRFVPYIMRAEIGIHEAATLEPDIDDAEVRKVVSSLIGQLQRGQSILADSGQPQNEMDLIEWCIKSNLAQAFEEYGPISPTDLIGCLKVILESIDTWTGRPLGKRGYLNYLAGFMRQLGVEVRRLSHEEAVAMGLAQPQEKTKRPDVDRMTLEELGRYWLAHDEEDWGLIDDFASRSSAEIWMGHADQVAQVCRSLLPETEDPYQRAELYYHLGVALRYMGDLEGSVQALQEAVRLGDEFYGAMIELGQTYFEQGNYQAALDIWLQEHSESGNVLTLRDIAHAYRMLGNTSEEERALRQFVDQSRSALLGLSELADCLRRQGKEAEASLIIRRILATTPHRRDPFEEWAYWLYYRLTMPHLAHAKVDPLKALDRISQEQQTGWPYLLRAVVYQARGDLDASRRALELAHEQTRWPVRWRSQLELVKQLFPAFQAELSALPEQPV